MSMLTGENGRREGILRRRLVGNRISSLLDTVVGIESSVFHPATDLRRLRHNALSRCRGASQRRKAFAWVAATWVVINCDKAQTRHTRNIQASLSLSLLFSRT